MNPADDRGGFDGLLAVSSRCIITRRRAHRNNGRMTKYRQKNKLQGESDVQQ
tara:strand:+ start:316 stop:471 length:156 start_codon:yes stop_codon:yes gene_type:complete